MSIVFIPSLVATFLTPNAPAPEAERSGVDFEKTADKRRVESSEEIRARVEVARSRQRERFTGLNNGVMTNADMRCSRSASIL